MTTPNDLRSLCSSPVPDDLLVTLPLAAVRALLAAIDAAEEHRAATDASKVGARYRDKTGFVWTVREADDATVRLTRSGAAWSLGAGVFAVQVRMGYLTAVTA